jgi:hypothetical protein
LDPGPSRRRLAAGLLAALVPPALLLVALTAGIPRAADLADHLGTTAQVLEQFRQGTVYPRWMSEFHRGWGEPTLVFYPPGLYFVAAAAALLAGGDVLSGFFLAIALLAAVGGLGMFFLVERRFGAWAGLLAAVLHAGVPYRYFELYASGLYSAFAAACLLPWAFLALWRIVSGGSGRRWVFVWPLTFAAICLFNLPSAVLLAYFVALWLVVEIAATRRFAAAARVAVGGVVGGLLAAVYLLPAVFELPAVVVPENARSHFASNFLFQGAASWMSPGLRSLFDRMGLFPALSALVSIAVLAMRRRSERVEAASSAWTRLLVTAAAAAFVLMTPLAGPAWRLLPVLHEVNLPWRLLEPLGTAAAALSAAAIARSTGDRAAPVLGRAPGLAALASLWVICGVFAGSISRVNGSFPASAARASLEQFASKEGYFLPKGARRAVDLSTLPRLACDRPCRVKIGEWSPARRRLTVDTRAGTHLALATYFFPGWRAQLEDTPSSPLPIAAEPGTGRLLVAVPPGTHDIAVEFGGTPDRTAGTIVSWLALLVWVAAAVRARRSRERAAAALAG